MDYKNLNIIKKMYSDGKNISEFLKKEMKTNDNTSEIIEIVYDLQAGSYINSLNENKKKHELYTDELAKLLDPHLLNHESLLDIGTGELTTLSLILNKIESKISQVFAFDISWSRVFTGKSFFEEKCINKNISLTTFVADIKRIPLYSKSIDVVTSMHALEPNTNNLSILLKEIFRVARKKCVLFEPSYELNSKEGKHRMNQLGYIKDIEGTVKNLGGKLIDVKLIENPLRSSNPTANYIIEPPKLTNIKDNRDLQFTVPGTDFILKNEKNFFISEDTGLLFPILKDIPILKSEHGIFGTALL